MPILLAHVKRISAFWRTERTQKVERKEVTEKGIRSKGKQISESDKVFTDSIRIYNLTLFILKLGACKIFRLTGLHAKCSFTYFPYAGCLLSKNSVSISKMVIPLAAFGTVLSKCMHRSSSLLDSRSEMQSTFFSFPLL